MDNGKLSIVLLVLNVVLITGAGTASPINLDSGKFVPEESQAEPQGFSSLSVSNNFDGYGLLQFREPVSSEERTEIEKEIIGLEFIDYIPENAWIVDYTGPKNDIVSRKNVRFFGPYRPSQRVSKSVKLDLSGEANVSVEFFVNSSDDLEDFDVRKEQADRVIVEVNSSELEELTSIEDVKHVGPVSPDKQVLNADTRQIIGANAVQASPYDLTGEGATAAMWDGGHAGDHEDLNYSVAWALKKNIKGDTASLSSHATHVAGTMLGGGKKNSDYRGVAPDARVVTHDFPSTFNLFSETDAAINNFNAMVSQNSWGQPPSDCTRKELYGNYNIFSRDYDQIISGETADVDGRIPVVFSAGNERNKCTEEYNTTIAPSTSKNIITVGSVDMNRDLAYYSSMGPTDDGRIKPTLVSHGGDYSTTGQVRSTVPGNSYGNKQGTSMAAPSVSGSILLLNEEFLNVYGQDPEPATVKAILIHTAEDLMNRGPDYKTGWGLINTTGAIDYINRSGEENLLKKGVVDQDESDSYEVKSRGKNDLKFTLVWSDKPASSSASETLVNDLDLVIKNDGERFYPWTMSWENRTEPALQDRPDRTNPQEQVVIENPETGSYSIEVEGHSVPEGPQSYSLIISDTEDDPAKITVESPEDRNYSEAPDFNASSDQELKSMNYSIDEESNVSLDKKNDKYFYDTEPSLNDGRHSLTFWAKNKINLVSSKEVSFTLDSSAPEINVSSPSNRSNVSDMFNLNFSIGDDVTGVSDYNVTLENYLIIDRFSGNSTVNSSDYVDGEYDLKFESSDYAGNKETERVEITVDNERPSASISKPSDEFFGNQLEIEYTVSDNVSGVESSEASILNESGKLASFGGNTRYDSSSLEDGNYTLEVNVTDYAGNRESTEKSLVKDTTEPDVDILLEERNVTVPFDVNASWNDSSGIDYSRFRLWNGSGTLNLTDLNTTVSRRDLNGSYNASFEIRDKAGNLFNETLEINISEAQLEVISPSKHFYQRPPVLNASYPAEVDDAYVEIDGQNYTLNKDGKYFTVEPALGNGSYQASFNVERYGEELVENSSFIVDSEKPSINSIKPVDDYNTSEDFDIELEASDSFSGIENSTYVLNNTEKKLNDTVDVSEFADGKYSLEFNTTDRAGNYRAVERDLTIDKNAPVLVDSDPVNNSNLSSGFSLNPSWRDLTGLNDSNTVLYNETFSSNNSSFETDDLADGEYTLSLWAQDFADNSVNVSHVLTVDTAAPLISSTSPAEGSVIFNETDVEAFIQDGTSGVKYRNLSIINSSGKVMSFYSNSTLNSSKLGDGNYTLNFSARDYSDNTGMKIAEFTVDNRKPEIVLNLSDLEELENGWRGPGNLSSTCTDAGAGVDSFNGTEINISESRNISIECTDKTGKKQFLTRNLSIDSHTPEIENITPANGSEVESEFDVEASVFDNESGVDANLSEFSVTDGSISSSLENDSFNATVSEASGTVELMLDISDGAGRTSFKVLEYSAPEEENNDDSSGGSGGGGGGGGGFSLPPDDEEEDQASNDTANDNNKVKENSASDNEDKPGNDTGPFNGSIKVDLERKTEIEVDDEESSINSVEVSGSGEASFNIVKVEESEGPEGSEVYETVDMDLEGENVSETKVSFKVRNEWMDDRNIEKHEVSLYRKNSSDWDKLETRPRRTGLETTTYTARVPEFSLFSVAASSSSASEAEAIVQEDQDSVEEVETEKESRSSGFDISIVDMVIIIIFISSGTVGAVFGYRYYRKRRMKASMEELRDMIGFDKELLLLINEAETYLESGNYDEASEKMSELTDKIGDTENE